MPAVDETALDTLFREARTHNKWTDEPVTDDTIRSLTLSQRALGTRHIILIHHTRCGLLGVDEARFRQDMLAETGMKPPWSLEAFNDLEDDLRSSVARVRTSPYLPHRDSVAGLVLDVDTGRLSQVM